MTRAHNCNRYGADGTLLQRVIREPLKLKSPVSPAAAITRPSSETAVDHIGALTYRKGALWRVDTPAGYIAGGTMHYYIRDHQGNVRQVTDADGNVEQDNHYYPYGMLMGESGDILDMARPGSTTKQSDANPYLYGGKEYLTTAGANLLDFTARTYDPSILLFHTPDPLRDKYLPVHSYLYCGANPIMFTDPSGMKMEDEKAMNTANNFIAEIHNTVGDIDEDITKTQTKIDKMKEEGKDISKEEQKIKNLKAQKDELLQSEKEIKEMISDEENTYGFKKVSDDGAHHVRKGDNGVIYVEYSSSELAIHEIRHIFQALKNGGFIFDNSGLMTNAGKSKGARITYELLAYRAQYSLKNISLPVKVNNIDKITPEWLQKFWIDGKNPYNNLF